ncbi:MAG: hypothetical protein AAF654_08295 [Myxococcota bacterium]
MRDARRRPSRAHRFVQFALSVVFGAAILVNIQAFLINDTREAALHITAAVFLTYLLAECLVYIRRSDALGLFSPVLMASFFLFFLGYSVGATASAFDPWIIGRHGEFLDNLPFEFAASTLLLAATAAFGMWRGYYFALRVAKRLRVTAQRWAPALRSSAILNWPAILGLEFGHLLLTVFAVAIGVYGVTSVAESRSQNLAILDLLNTGIAAGNLSFFLFTVRYETARATRRLKPGYSAVFYSLLALHLFTGVLTAFKSQFVFPFLIVVAARFVATKRVSTGYLHLAALALFVAYQTVEPYRAYLGQAFERPDSILQIVEGYKEAFDNRERYASQEGASFVQQLASRLDVLGASSIAVKFADEGLAKGGMREKLQRSIFLAPILAFVPRAIWTGKESYNTGTWFAQRVLKRPSTSRTSIGMGPVGFLSIAGGRLGVFIGFFALGCLQAIFFDGFARSGAGGFVIFLGVANFLIIVPSDFGPALTGALRLIPFAFLAQFVLLHGRSNSSRLAVSTQILNGYDRVDREPNAAP